MACCAWRQFAATSHGLITRAHPKSPRINCCCSNSFHVSPSSLRWWSRGTRLLTRWSVIVAMATPESEGIVPSQGDEDDGVSLGTMKLPPDTDLQRFESLLFQWANSLCQGANLPLPVPLKVDKVPGGARLGFITIGDGKTEVPVHIDCLVLPPTEGGSAPIFRAIRNGPQKDQPPPGEPRIMRSLLQALKKSVEIARL